MELYNKLVHTQATRQQSWIGNLRWFVEEGPQECCWEFRAAPKDAAHSRAPGCAVRDMFTLSVPLSGSEVSYQYRADSYCAQYTGGSVKITMPWEEYGAMLQVSAQSVPCSIKFARSVHFCNFPDFVLITDQDMYFCIAAAVPMVFRENEIFFSCKDTCRIAVSFHAEQRIAMETCSRLFERRKEVCIRSASFWNSFLSSCPIHRPSYGNAAAFDLEEVYLRQFWHWWAALINLSSVAFNSWPIYLAPDKSKWFGSWSNDTPEALAALSLTCAAPLVREAIVGYIARAIRTDGIHAWYTHADGQQSFGVQHDAGRFSHGVPCIVHTVEYYIRATGDRTILQADADGMRVWDKLCHYMHSLLPQRDCNADGLIECSNLWESGWDDKTGPFFEKQPLSAWVSVITNGTDKEIAEFYRANQAPVTAMVEQVYALWAFASLHRLAVYQENKAEQCYAKTQYQKILSAVRSRHWSEQTGFYHDRDVNNDKLNPVMNLDAFYFLYFEPDRTRIARMLEKLNDPKKFALPYPPATAADGEGFCPDGYWSGGYWPREMCYVGMGLAQAGAGAAGERLILQAIVSAPGNQICETLNPLTGKRTTKPVRLAYGAMLIAALQHLEQRMPWCILPQD